MQLPKKREEGSEEWILTFGDMMALLLTFFVLLVAISDPDKGKFEKAMDSIKEALGAVRAEDELGGSKKEGSTFEAVAKQVQDMISQSDLQSSVQTEVTERGVVLNVAGGALFKPGSVRVEKSMEVFLLRVAMMAKKLPYKIIVEGHTDDTKVRGGPYPSNWELSAARAAAVVRFMVDEGGLEPGRFTASGFAEYRPLYAPTPENRAKNRRVEIIISREGYSQ